MSSDLKGIMCPIVSPCDENDVFLEDTFAKLARWLCRAGVHGLYVCGLTGDGLNMRVDERKRAAEIAVEISHDCENKVIVHVGAGNMRDAMELARHAAQIGADAVSSIPPNSHGCAQLVSYYDSIARAAEIPVLIYHLPAITHCLLTLDELRTLLDIDGVVGLKMTEWNLFLMKQLRLARPDIVLFGGYDEVTVPSLLYGACGEIGSWCNLFPGLYVNIYSAVQEGDLSYAMDLQNRLLAFLDLATRVGVVPVLSFFMKERGFGPYCFRRPRQVLDRDTVNRIERELQQRIAECEEIVESGRS